MLHASTLYLSRLAGSRFQSVELVWQRVCIDLQNTSMETVTFKIFLVLSAYLLGNAKAFLPRIYLAMENSATLDHTLITKKGFLAPLVYFLKDNPQYLKDEQQTTFLQDALISDSSNAWRDIMESISPQIKFLNALKEIQSANVEVDSFLNSSASAHFDGEQFKQSSQRIVQLRQELVTSLLKGNNRGIEVGGVRRLGTIT